MSIQDLGALGEVISSVAVLATLIYLSLQVRQGGEQARLASNIAQGQASAAIHARYADVVMQLGANPEFRRVHIKMQQGTSLTELSPDELLIMNAIMHGLLLAAQDAFLMRKRGVAPDETETGDYRAMRTNFLTMPVIQEWWTVAVLPSGTFGDEFRELITRDIAAIRNEGNTRSESDRGEH